MGRKPQGAYSSDKYLRIPQIFYYSIGAKTQFKTRCLLEMVFQGVPSWGNLFRNVAIPFNQPEKKPGLWDIPVNIIKP